ncbi:MAG TPA: peptide ABC transporter substrate-binding protein [Candidatus Sulfomarinibacteraceae bacterium]|nr:peptide ABC transporter substrate-binding protein [Candidatus Sulfomarinibacteraceae bacterium]
MVNRRAALFVGLLLAAFFLLNCNTVTGLFPSGSSAPALPPDVGREEAIVLLGSQPRTLDPALTHGGPSGPIGHIFSGLVNLDRSLRVEPDLAAGWDVDETGTTYTFYLRRNAVFHDGRPLTADDVRFSWERAADPQTASDTAQTYLGDIVGVNEMLKGEADHIRGVRVLDDHTLQVQIDAAKVTFLAKLAYPVAFVVDRDNVDDPEWEHGANGSGPFRLDVWEDDRIMVLARHDGYYRDPASVPHLVYLMDAGLPLARYEAGEIDMVSIGGNNLERARDPNSPLFADLRTGVSMCTSYVGFNVTKPPFDDPLVRRAFSHALDRERLVSGLLDGNALQAEGPLPPGMPGFSEREPAYEYDPQQARELLAEGGYDPGSLSPLTFTTAGYSDVGGFVSAVITMWQDNLGVTIEPALLDPFTYIDSLYAGDVGHFYNSGWCADYPDPENFLDVLFHSNSPQNLGRFSDPAIDAMLQEARVEADVSQRLARYREIETAVIEAAPSVFVSHDLSAALVKPYIQGYELTPIGIPQWHRVRLVRE